jgi:hypothetical protein
MAGTITVGELLSDPTSSNKITIGTGTTLDLVSGAGSVSMPSASLTGALPALDGANLTGLTSANLTGALPVIDGSSLTGVGGATGTMILSEKAFDEVSVIAASLSTYSSGNTVSFPKTKSSTESILIYCWNGYIDKYVNSGSYITYRMGYTPSGGSIAYTDERQYRDQETGEWRKYFPLCYQQRIATLGVGTHTFTMQCKHSGGNNNNSQLVTDSHNYILIREVLI